VKKMQPLKNWHRNGSTFSSQIVPVIHPAERKQHIKTYRRVDNSLFRMSSKLSTLGLLILAAVFLHHQELHLTVQAIQIRHANSRNVETLIHRRRIRVRADKKTIRDIALLRGGSYVQPNPDYNDPNQFMPPKLGDVENDHIRRPHPTNHDTSYRNTGTAPKPIAEVVQEFFMRLYQSSPALFYGTTSSIFMFLLWQIPSNAVSATLRRHFICSQYNLVHKRYHTLLTSSISHTTLSHIFMNIYGFLTFGKSVEPILKRNHISLQTFCVLAAIFANIFFVKLHPDGSCIGLSGVSLALLAFDAKMYPGKEIGFLVRFIPIRLPAQYALAGLLLWSSLGILATKSGKGDGVAHATHFGGLVYGVAIYELMKRGIWANWRKKLLRFWLINAPRRGSKRKIGSRYK
jgi:membrane associated rhomboid family serine protease